MQEYPSMIKHLLTVPVAGYALYLLWSEFEGALNRATGLYSIFLFVLFVSLVGWCLGDTDEGHRSPLLPSTIIIVGIHVVSTFGLESVYLCMIALCVISMWILDYQKRKEESK